MRLRKKSIWQQPVKPSYIFLSALALVVVISLSWNSSTKPRPNIIIFVVDSLRLGYLGSYGFEGNISPHIDAFAKQSVLFEKCVAPSSWTGPSVASLFTGLYPASHGMLGKRSGQRKKGGKELRDMLPKKAITLAELLKQNGYFTYGITGNAWVSPRFGFDQGFDAFEGHTLQRLKVFGIWYMVERIIPKLAKKKDPFFLYLHFMDTHSPYDSDPAYFNELKQSPSLGKNLFLSENVLIEAEKVLKMVNLDMEHEMKHHSNNWKACYAGAVKKFDKKFSVLMELFQQQGLMDNTVVILTSDHGEAFFENGSWYHGKDLHWNQIDVPFLIRFPGDKKGGTRIKQPISLVDVLPSLMEISKSKWAGNKTHGESFIPYLSSFRKKEKTGKASVFRGGLTEAKFSFGNQGIMEIYVGPRLQKRGPL